MLESDVRDDHAAVHRLAHVVHREQGNLDSGQRLHLDARAAHGLGGGFAMQAAGLPIQLKLKGNPGERERVAQGNQIGGALRTHDARNPGDTQNISLAMAAFADEGQGPRLHADPAIGNGDAAGLTLCAHVDHVGLARGVEMGQGLHSVLTLSLAEALGVDPDHVIINQTDTATCPWDVGTHASRGAFMACNAAILAADKLRARIFTLCETIYPELVANAAEKCEPHTVATYLRELSADFHTWYNAHKMLVEEQALRDARLALSAAVRQVIANGLHLLGVSAPDSM